MKISKRFYTVAELAAAAVFVYLLAYPAKAAEKRINLRDTDNGIIK